MWLKAVIFFAVVLIVSFIVPIVPTILLSETAVLPGGILNYAAFAVIDILGAFLVAYCGVRLLRSGIAKTSNFTTYLVLLVLASLLGWPGGSLFIGAMYVPSYAAPNYFWEMTLNWLAPMNLGSLHYLSIYVSELDAFIFVTSAVLIFCFYKLNGRAQ